MFLIALRCPSEILRRATLVLVATMLAGCAVATEAVPADTGRIVAMGDVHGDYDAFLALMSQAGLIDAKGRWSGKQTVFLQLGDAVDRGPKSRDVILCLQRLQREASRAGGKVIALIGNHEAMNMTGDLRYVPPVEFQNYVTRHSKSLRDRIYETNKSKLETDYRKTDPQLSDADVKRKFQEQYPLGYFEHRLAWAPDGEFGHWVLSNPAVAIVGDSLYVHGGISAKYATYSVGQINDLVHGALGTPATDDDAILQDEMGPLWYRGLAEDTAQSANDVAEVLKAYSVRRIIIAHTPNLKGIKVLDQGLVILIDTGITASYGGTHSYLSIEGTAILAHDDGNVTELKSAE